MLFNVLKYFDVITHVYLKHTPLENNPLMTYQQQILQVYSLVHRLGLLLSSSQATHVVNIVPSVLLLQHQLRGAINLKEKLRKFDPVKPDMDMPGSTKVRMHVHCDVRSRLHLLMCALSLPRSLRVVAPLLGYDSSPTMSPCCSPSLPGPPLSLTLSPSLSLKL